MDGANIDASEGTGPERFLAIVGPTAAGKTALSVAVGEALGAEVISVDSMQVYRGMDVGTAKPEPELQARMPHHVIDCAAPTERYDARRYLADVDAALEGLAARGVTPLHVGGTGFYLKALTHGLFEGPPADLELRASIERRAAELGPGGLHAELGRVDAASAARIHPNDERRVVRALEVLEQTGRTLSEWQREWRESETAPAAGRERRLVGLEIPPDELDERIVARTREMLDAGWADEARAIRDGVGFGPSAVQALGYREVLRYADGELTRDEVTREIALRTRQFARRQRTWFRNFPEIHWIPAPRTESEVEAATREALRHFAE